jgi:hypothetical protein
MVTLVVMFFMVFKVIMIIWVIGHLMKVIQGLVWNAKVGCKILKIKNFKTFKDKIILNIKFYKF